MSSPHRGRLLTCLALLAALVPLLPSAARQPAARSAPRAETVRLLPGRLLRPDGTLASGMGVVIHEGKVHRVVKARKLKEADCRTFGPDTVLCPGLIDLFSSIGAGGEPLDSVRLVDPRARAVDAVDPSSPDFDVALAAGVTAAMVAPAPRSLVAGRAVTFRTFRQRGQLDVLRDDGPLILAFGQGVWQRERPPTSRAGTVAVLRRLVQQATAPEAGGPLAAVCGGRSDALIVCRTAADLDAVRSVWDIAAGRVGVVQRADAIDVAAELKGLALPVVVGPYGFASSRRELLAAAALADAGVAVAFSGGLPVASLDAVRISAALAVRSGMDPAAARRAMTIGPARAAGVPDLIGSIAPGKDADLVVFSRDPLRLDATVLEVYVRGARVYSAANQKRSMEAAE